MMSKRNFTLASFLVVIFFLLSACGSSTSTGASASKSTPLSVYGDLVSGKNGCMLQSHYAPGDRIVFRMNALDPTTQKQDQNATLEVHLSTGDVLKMKLASHSPTGKGEPMFWTAAYPVTNNTPTGTMTYYVTATDGKRTGEFKPFNVKQSLITIVSSN